MKKIIIVAAMFSLLACTGKDEISSPNSNGKLSGTFSVSMEHKVCFSQGNLQYNHSTDTWRFAEHQYDFIGEDNLNITNPQYLEWIDLFGWGTGKAPMQSSANDDIYGAFYDWGINKISNGGNKENVWRTLTKSEWVYLFHDRPYAESLFGLGIVNQIKGAILLPDKWTLPEGMVFNDSQKEGLEWIKQSERGLDMSYYNGTNDCYSQNTYTIEEWKKMESAGAVFLPAAGYRYVSQVETVGTNGIYWSATNRSTNDAHNLIFNSHQIWPQMCYDRYYGLSVRLVKDVE